MPANSVIQLRRGTAAQWTSANPVLAAGEPGYETDTGKEKRGDGATAWASLPYFTPGNGTFERLTTFNVKTYGAPWNGVGDDRPGFQAAVDAAVATITATGKGAIVRLPPGVGTMTSTLGYTPTGYTSHLGIALPVNLPAELVIQGAGKNATMIRLTDSARSAFWVNKQADHDIFQNVTMQDFSVDNNNTVGRCQVLVGNVPEYSTPQKYLGLNNLRFSRLGCTNVPVDVTQATTYKSFIWFFLTQTTANEATIDNATNVICEDLDMYDVHNGVVICSPVPTSVSVYYDNIIIRRCRHVLSTIPAATLSQTSYYICGAGYGDRCQITDCYSENIGDDSIEVGAMQTILIDRLTSINPFLEGILFRNTHPLVNPEEQQVVVRDSRFVVDSRPLAVPGTSGFSGRPVFWISDSGAGNFGSFVFERCDSVLRGGSIRSMSRSDADLGWRIVAPARRVVMRDCRAHISGTVYDVPSNNDYFMLVSRLAPTGNITGGSSSTAELLVRDFEVVVENVTNSNTGVMFLSAICPQGVNYRATFDGMTYNIVDSPISSATLAYLGYATGTIRAVYLRRLSGVALGGSGSVSRRSVRVAGTGSITKLTIEQSDLSAWTGSTFLDIDVSSATATTLAGLIERNNRYSQTSEVVSVSANYTALVPNRVILATGTLTVTTPAPRPTAEFTVINTGTGTVTVTPASGTVNGAANTTLTTQWSKVTLVSDGTNWFTKA